jgi:hypothetical protein
MEREIASADRVGAATMESGVEVATPPPPGVEGRSQLINVNVAVSFLMK